MTYNTFIQLYNAALEQEHIEKFIYCGYQNWMDTMPTPYTTQAVLEKIYHFAKAENKWAAFADEMKSLKYISELYHIPYSTIQKWNTNVAQPTEYIILLMMYTVIIDIINFGA